MLQPYLSLKPLYYDKIDYSRMPRVYESIKQNLASPKIIHLIGTNAKGTTGRFLATALSSLGYNVGHYTSPHILNFNERVWINGRDADDETLEVAHKKLQKLLKPSQSKSLSYFEYTTLLAMLVYERCEVVVMEAGLGGEHDATAVFEKALTIVTPIAYDHEAFLGNTIKEIATTKLNAIQNNAILGLQSYDEVYEVATSISKEKSLNIKRVDELLDTKDTKMVKNIAKKLKLQSYLQDNLALSISALNFLGIAYNEDSFRDARLFGRLSYIAENIIVDVGHNLLAATAIRDALEPQKYILIYNSYKDKNYQEILKRLKPIIKHLEIMPIKDKRAVEISELKSNLTELKIEYSTFTTIKENQDYLVFGSFSVVEAFMRRNLDNE